jgi:SH3-like domain-containing protein
VLRRVKQLAPGCLLAAACFNPFAAPAAEVRVTGSRVNLRAAPRADAEVVGQSEDGAVLNAPDGVSGAWVKVQAPPHARAWVYGDLLQDGKVRVSAAQVRSGPGINYAVIGRLTEGAEVRVVDSHAGGEWLRIEPPPGVMVWISADHVTARQAAPSAPAPRASPSTAASAPAPAPPAAEAGPGRKPPLPVGNTAVLPTPAPRPAPRAAASGAPTEPAGTRAPNRLAADKPQGERVVVEGSLTRSVLVWRRPSRYAIVGRDERGRAETLCYLQDDWQRLVPLIGKPVRAIGIRYWVQGVRNPVVVVESITAE